MESIILQISSYITAVGVIVAALNKTLNKKIDPINEKIDNNEKDNLRYKILSFANSLHNGDNHTRQEYETIFFFYDKYEAIIKRLDMTNGYLETEMEFIRDTYKRIYGGVL
ncbi:MAG: hypothetical protein J5982_03280 [Bacilli bacterium]|nr:hypothetical protein [Bacilli bacterium]